MKFFHLSFSYIAIYTQLTLNFYLALLSIFNYLFIEYDLDDFIHKSIKKETQVTSIKKKIISIY